MPKMARNRSALQDVLEQGASNRDITVLQPTITNISFKIAHLNIQFNLTGVNELKINILPIKITKEIYFHKVTSA